MEALFKDLRFGVRMLFKHPGLSLIAIGTFGLGIGLTTTVFRMVNGALWKGLPVEQADRVVAVERTDLSRNSAPLYVTLHDFADWREQQTVFDDIALFGDQVITVNLSESEGRPERYVGVESTANLFRVLRVNPVLGRTFREGEDMPGAEPVMLIGFDVWRDRYEFSRDVVGRTVDVNGARRTIIGVMPEGFRFPDRQQAWVPMEFDPVGTPRGEGTRYIGIARIKQGVTLDEAKSQMATIAARLERAYPETNEGIGAAVDRFTVRFVGRQFKPLMLTMLGAVIGVLLIACSNVANLLLAQVSARVREVAVRTALGASRARVVRQFFVEVLILSSIGGVLGFGLGELGMRAMNGLMQLSPPPFWITFEVDHRVTVFVIAMTTLATIVSGLMPAVRASGTDLGEALKDESRGASSFKLGRLSAGFVVAEVAVSCALLIGSGLMIKSVVQMRRTDLPFATENIFTARVSLPAMEYPDSASRIQFYERLLPQMEAIPGVQAATLSDGLPGSGNGGRVFEVDGHTYSTDDDFPVAREGIVTPGYFRTFAVDLLQGRAFNASDRKGSLPVTVVNESFARTFFTDGQAIGKRIRMDRRDTTAAWLTVVGVAPDLHMQGIANLSGSPAGFYIPISQSGVGTGVSMALRTSGDPTAITSDVRAAVGIVDPNLPIYDVFTLGRVLENATWMYRIFGSIFMALGFFALFLAAVGLYGVMSFAASLRTHEIGIRMALGARGAQLVRLVLQRGIVQLAVGLGLGICLATLAAGPLQTILYDVSARDAFVFGTVAVTLAAVGILASLFPALRVIKVSPVTALTTRQ
jgi:predicted permease